MRITSWLIAAVFMSQVVACGGNQVPAPPSLNGVLAGTVEADDEATRSREPISDIGELQKILRTEEIFTFGGLFLEREPRRRLIVQFTRDGEEIIRPYVAGGPLE
ncbi:MAG: hypothetical protein IIC93_08175, partial [Chloroflexi bacterium]|nr:hypothetical protein [Chloroflexota bacterium]